MALNWDSSVTLSDPQIQDFLFDQAQTRLALDAPEWPGFSRAESREALHPDGSGAMHRESVEYMVAELYAIEKQGSAVGVNKAIVSFEQPLAVTADVWLFLKDDAPADAKAHARSLFSAYDPAQHGPDIEDWVARNQGDVLTSEMYAVEPAVVLTKDGDRREKNIDQRLALLALYGDGRWENTEIHVVGDYPMDRWARDQGVTARKVGEERVSQGGPPQAREIREVPPGQADAQVGSILDDILRHVIPTDCGVMRRQEHKLLTLFSWPEFKLEWRRKRVRIGCASVTIVYPVLRTRTAKMVFFVHYSLPHDVARMIFKVAETCAIRSALAGGVVGVVSGNPGAALATFNGLFQRCMEREIVRCIHPGIILVKEVGPWS